MSKTELLLKSMALAFSKEMAYKANFIIKVFALMIADFVGPIVTTVIYATTAGVPGWSFEQFLLLQGIFIFVMGAMHFSQIAIAWRTVHEVREGNFDKFMLRPYNPLTYLTLTSWDPEGLGEVAVGVSLIAYSILKLGISILSLNFVFFIALLALALVFTYSIVVLIASFSFIFVKSFGLFNIFFQVMEIARYPATIYDYGMRFFISFLIPVSVAATFPALTLIGQYGLNILYVAVSVFAFLALSLVLWNVAMKKYSSAGG
ncbi:ABC-2 family transporter protein [Candidatus Woesearchaeota archaeon]|nr:ABC-2 family transporter protein [Candidatus Woesearchaeota archaeon]